MNSNSSINNNYNNNISSPSNHLLNEKGNKEIKTVVGSPFCTSINLNYAMNAIKCSRKKANKISKSEKSKNFKNNCLLSIEYLAHKNLSKRYNYTKDKYNLLAINFLLSNKTCRMVSLFKEEMITDFVDEFLKRKYSFKESKERIPKFYLYYKHYSIFFGQPFFTNFSFNVLLQKNGEKKARIYYKNHYQNGESKDEDNENIGFAESGSEDEDEEKKTNNIKKNHNNTIFNSGVKDNIDNVTLMTTINSLENNTINLELNNEKIEIFSENKMERSNDTTIGDLMEDIYKGIEEAHKKNKNLVKKKKKKNFSLGDNFYNLIKKNINNNVINENIKKNKKKLIELINNNNKKKIKNNSIKKKLFYAGHSNVNNNGGTALSSNTQRNTNKTNKINYLNKKNISSNDINNGLKSNKSYKKRKLLSYTNEEVNKLIDPNNKHKSPRIGNNNNLNLNLNSNRLNTINTNNIYGNKKLGNFRKINSPLQINKKQNNFNSNNMLTSINNNYNNKIKICKTLKALEDKNKKKKVISKNINKDLYTISGDAKKKINKISFKKLDLGNISETQIFKEKHLNKKEKGRNIISPLNNKYIGTYTLTNEFTNLNNLPFSANKNKNLLINNKLFNSKAIFNSINFQTININEPEMYHQRTKSNLIQNNIKKRINNQTISKVLNTEINNAYIKPAIRIRKNDKLYMSKALLNDINNENKFENKTSINNNTNNNKKPSQNNAKILNNINNSNILNELKRNDLINIIHNNNLNNTNFNKYILEVIKKTKHQHFNSLTSKINNGHTLNLKGNLLSKNKKKITNLNLNNKGYKDKDILQIALSLFVNDSSSRNRQNQTNILESLNSNSNFNTYYKLDNNQTTQKYPNNNKRNYNLNININNEININENNAINNSSYVNHTQRINSKNNATGKNILNNYFGDMNKKKEKKHYIANLKHKKYNIDNTFNINNKCSSKSTKNNNDNLIFNLNNNNKKGKKTKTRNYTNKNLNDVLTSINNNNFLTNAILNNNSVDNNKYIVKNHNKHINNNTIKSYHTKSVTSLSDLMFHNKKLISLYKNLSKSK